MMDIETFATTLPGGTPSGLNNALDPSGSSQDMIFAKAIEVSDPTTVLEEAGIIVVQKAPADVDEIRFPIVRNTRMTWSEIDGRTGSNALGSELNSSALNAVEFRKVRPTVKTTNYFLPDSVNLLNKVTFDTLARRIAADAKRKREEDALLYIGSNVTTHVYAANTFTSAGSVNAGSTLTPLDLVKAKRVLSTGSDIYVPDFCLVHPNQYEKLNTDSSFAPGATATGAMLRKAKFNSDGDLVRFDGMDIFVSELMPKLTGSATTVQEVDGHWAYVGKRGICVARGEHEGIKVYTQDERLRHGQFKIFDISYAHDLLVEESIVKIRCAD